MFVQETFYKTTICQRIIKICIFYKKELIVNVLKFHINTIANFFQQNSFTFNVLKTCFNSVVVS